MDNKIIVRSAVKLLNVIVSYVTQYDEVIQDCEDNIKPPNNKQEHFNNQILSEIIKTLQHNKRVDQLSKLKIVENTIKKEISQKNL